jgi:hypothetical protein
MFFKRNIWLVILRSDAGDTVTKHPPNLNQQATKDPPNVLRRDPSPGLRMTGRLGLRMTGRLKRDSG